MPIAEVLRIPPTPDLEEVRAANAALAGMPHPDVTTAEGLAALRVASFTRPMHLELNAVNTVIPGPAGPLNARVIRPDGRVRAVLHNIHGGGFCIGAPDNDDWFCDLLARECQIAVVSTSYRLAPENPFPAGLDDCIAGAQWLLDNVRSEFGTDRLLVGGGSAGGYYAAQVLLWLRSVGEIDRVGAANLLFGIYDLSRTPSQRAATKQTLVLTSDWIAGFHHNAFPGLHSEQLRAEPYSPLYANLAGLPPALFTVGGLDPLLDDSLFMAARWQAAGNVAHLDVWPECAHGFANMYPHTGRRAWLRMAAWLNAQLECSE